MKRALTPGTFDPITSGHLDVITRAAQLVDEVVVAVAASPKKKPLFSLEERAELVRRATSHLPNVRVEPFDELLVDLAASSTPPWSSKGLRAITDFEYEFQMTALNYQLNQELETLFIMVAAAVHVSVVVYRARDREPARRRGAVRSRMRERGVAEEVRRRVETAR